MYNITLIGTGHTEIGKCNSIELYKIIETIKPEIIFEELRVSLFNECYNENKHCILLEPKAIKEYIKKYQSKHITVDTYEIKNFDYVDFDVEFLKIFKLYKNLEYHKLQSCLSLLTERGGFKFLNSNQYDLFFEKMKALVNNIVTSSGNTELSNLYKLQIDTDDKRENEMLFNIYNYSKKYKFSKGLLYTGAAHRKSISKKINQYFKKEEPKINWLFYS